MVSFTGEVTLEQGLTGNVARLRRAIDQVEFVPPSGYIGGGVVVGGTPPISGTQQTLAGSTAIWDAIWATSNELLTDSAEHQRRAIILLTDGEDTISQVRMQEAISRALKADALIYAIGIGDRYTFGINESALKKITEGTGGRAYFPRNVSPRRPVAIPQKTRKSPDLSHVSFSDKRGLPLLYCVGLCGDLRLKPRVRPSSAVHESARVAVPQNLLVQSAASS